MDCVAHQAPLWCVGCSLVVVCGVLPSCVCVLPSCVCGCSLAVVGGCSLDVVGGCSLAVCVCAP